MIIRELTLFCEDHLIFKNLNFTLPEGQWSCILGSSGSGKTTLLRLIAGLTTETHRITRGTIHSEPVAYMAQTDLLLPWVTALENSLLGLRLNKTLTPTKIDDAKNLFKKLGLQSIEKKYPHELSGGMRQRVALIRTFLQEKNLILMDEPYSALDIVTRIQLQTLTRSLLKDKTVLMVTHDPFDALRLADHIFILSGTPAQLTHAMTLNEATERLNQHADLLAQLMKHQSEPSCI